MGLLSAGKWQKASISSSVAAYEGHIGGVGVVLAVSGVGRARAEATARLVLENLQPRSMLSLGFAGGLVPGQRAGGLVVVQTLVPMRILANGSSEPLDMEPIASHPELYERAAETVTRLDLRHDSGACVTASRILSRPEEKRRLAKATGALAVEMESYWTAMVCREFQVPFLTIRSIVDELDSPLPDYIARVALDTGPQGRWKHVLPTLLRPHHAPGLVKLAFAATAARRSLTKFVKGFVGTPAQAITA